MVDRTYASRKKAALAAGLLWGAYHFADNSDVEKQVDNFLSVVKPDDTTLLCLDYEPNGARTMSLAQAKQFLQLVYDRTGQRPVLYSGNLLKEQLTAPDEFLCRHRLWLAQYGRAPKLPCGWSNYWLWQYTGDGIGPKPHSVPGIKTQGIDLNVFAGNDLAAEWVDKAKTIWRENPDWTPDEPAETAQMAPVTPQAPQVTAKDLAPLSRKVSLVMRLRNWAAGLGIGGTGLSLADLKEQSGTLHDLAQMFRDHAFLILIAGCLIGVIVASVLIAWTVEDHNAGRYRPSKAEG